LPGAILAGELGMTARNAERQRIQFYMRRCRNQHSSQIGVFLLYVQNFTKKCEPFPQMKTTKIPLPRQQIDVERPDSLRMQVEKPYSKLTQVFQQFHYFMVNSQFIKNKFEIKAKKELKIQNSKSKWVI